MTNLSLGWLLYNGRTQRNLRRAEMARMLGIAENIVTGLETNSATLSPEEKTIVFKKLAIIFEIDQEYIELLDTQTSGQKVVYHSFRNHEKNYNR